MAEKKRPLDLYFVSTVRVRGEHIIGTDALKDDGSPNMIIVKRGETRKIQPDAAQDLVLSKQAISVAHAKPVEMAEAKALNEQHAKDLERSEAREKQNRSKQPA